MSRRRLRSTISLAVSVCASLSLAAGSAFATGGGGGPCVGAKPGCSATLQAALDKASDGDTIQLLPGTYAGGVMIGKSVSLVGVAGAKATTIKGGGPVLTIFRETDTAGLTVSIKGLTITGGVNQIEAVNFGGGVWIPPSELPVPPYNGPGATVTIADSAITGNVVTAQSVVPPGDFCGPLPCAFNIGGGISSGGVLTLVDTRVSDNTAGSTPSLVSLASGSIAGGINQGFTGTLRLKHSVVSGNHAVVTRPNGQFADNGGINSGGALTVEDSVVSDNTVDVTSALPEGSDEASASAGGLGVSGAATIRNTIVRGNRVSVRNLTAGALSNTFAGGLDVQGQLVLERSVVSENAVRSISAGDAIADGGGLEVTGEATIRDTLISRNSVVAEAGAGAFAAGAGIANAGKLTLERTLVLDNSASATGSGAEIFGFPSAVKGGGIWNSTFDGVSTGDLTLTNSAILRNTISGPSSFVIQGGGLYTDFPVTKTGTLIAANKPDQCFGC